MGDTVRAHARLVVGVLASLAVVASAGALSAVPTVALPEQGTACSGSVTVPAPQDARATFLGGNASPPLPVGEPGTVAVVAVGPYSARTATVPVVVRNNTCAAVAEVCVFAWVLPHRIEQDQYPDSDGDSCSVPRIEPPIIGPGEIGIGELYFGDPVVTHRAPPPPDARYDLKVAFVSQQGPSHDECEYSVSPCSDEPARRVFRYRSGTALTPVVVDVSENRRGHPALHGAVRNVGRRTVEGPALVQAWCFDASGTPIAAAFAGAVEFRGPPRDDLTPGVLEPGERAPFSGVRFPQLSGVAACPVYLVGVHGVAPAAALTTDTQPVNRRDAIILSSTVRSWS
jgi:hypothetical protein